MHSACLDVVAGETAPIVPQQLLPLAGPSVAGLNSAD